MKKLVKIFLIADILVLSLIGFCNLSIFSNIHLKMINASIGKNEILVRTIFSESYINKLTYKEPTKINNDNYNVVVCEAPQFSFENPYDEEILTREVGNEDYKYLRIKVGIYDAHLVVVYHPEKVHIMTSRAFNTLNNSGKDKLTEMNKRYNAIVGINGGGFEETETGGIDRPKGYVIQDGEIIWKTNDKEADLIAMGYNNKLMLLHTTGEDALNQGVRDALEFGPFLIKDGKITTVSAYAGGFARAARSAIGQRKDGVMLFLTTEGMHENGPTLKEITEVMQKYGAENAANLDGGTSTQLVVDDKLLNTPYNLYGKIISGGRPIVTAWGVIKN